MNSPDLYTPAEAAKVLWCHTKTVIRAAERHGLRIIRTRGGHRRFLAAEIDALAVRRTAERERAR